MYPTTPQKAAGRITEPSVCVPTATGTKPAATAAAAAQRYDFSQRYLMEYFDKLKFGFTPEYRAGLEEFYRRAAAIGELERIPDVGAGARP